MNHINKSISYSRSSWCQLKRLQSSLSTSNSKIEIPSRIERGPTDILRALDSTVPRDPLRSQYKFHDDTFLLPTKKGDFRFFPLSYEAGKKTAMWIHKEHSDLFPKDLSDPPVKEFQPPHIATYTDKSQVSEEMLLQAITEKNLTDVVQIYKLLEDNISNETKQALLELLCFFNGDQGVLNPFVHERWACKPQKRRVFVYNPDIDKLYKDLKQDSATATAAHNAMICGFAKWNQADRAWLIFEECRQKKIPLSVNTYNYVISVIPNMRASENKKCKEILHDIFALMNEEGVQPNVRTLNAAISVAVSISEIYEANDLVSHLLAEFKRLNIKPSLASYYYIAKMYSSGAMYEDFLDLLDTVAEGEFTIQDPTDVKFFPLAMEVAFRCYSSKEAGHMIHKILLSGNNYQFLSNGTQESSYYYAYMSLVLSTSNIQEFSEFYHQIVPSVFIPELNLAKQILESFQPYPVNVIEQYLPRFWADMQLFNYADSAICFTVINLMTRITSPADPSSTRLFADTACNVWDYMMKEREKGTHTEFHTYTIANIVILLLRGDRIDNASTVLKEMMKDSSTFVANMSKDQGKLLFETCVSKNCIDEALLVLEYCLNLGFGNVYEMVQTFCEDAKRENAYRDRLTKLVGKEALQRMSTSSSSN